MENLLAGATSSGKVHRTLGSSQASWMHWSAHPSGLKPSPLGSRSLQRQSASHGLKGLSLGHALSAPGSGPPVLPSTQAASALSRPH